MCYKTIEHIIKSLTYVSVVDVRVKLLYCYSFTQKTPWDLLS